MKEERKDNTVYKISANEIHSIIGKVKNKSFFAIGVEQFGKLLKRASSSRISLAEMKRAQKILIAENVNAEKAEHLIPYAEVCSSYQNVGLYDAKKEHLMKGEGTIWKPNDHRRIAIMNGAVGLLKREPDIVNYLDIY